jgi:hypothetical protein
MAPLTTIGPFFGKKVQQFFINFEAKNSLAELDVP